MKKRIIILGGVVFAVIIAWSLAWFVLSGIVRQQIELQAQADGITSPQITCGTLTVGGYPFRFDADCTNAHIVTGDAEIDVPAIRASIRVYAPTHMLASALGPLQVTDTFTGSRNAVAWSTLEASVRLQDWRIARASISGKQLVWSDTLLGETTLATADVVEAHLFDIPEQHDGERHLAALAGYLLANGATYPGMTLTDANAEVQLELTGLPDDVRVWGAPDLLATMQAAGSTLDIVAVHATDAASTLDANGTLTLDASNQIDGQITIASTGVAERVGPLLEEPWRTLVLGSPGADGTYSNQLNFRSGGIFSGLVPIAAIGPLF
ncbi:MAG: DUF2125 domain-containing protein [Alphaproteobacteria bacterium]|nr:DUF2125 domain-containing protein [Alphaproteobacteria bacterium]